MRPRSPATALRTCALALSVAVAPLYAQGPTASSVPPAAVAPETMLGPGDVVRITVWENAALSGEFEVAEDGTLRHPVYSRLSVTRMPVDSVKAAVVRFLRNFQRDPLVSVEPLVRVTVLGEVRVPNSYLLAPTATVADAVVKAGGNTDRGRLNRVVLEHGGVRRTIDLLRAAPSTLPRLHSGDRILVSRESAWFTEVIAPVSMVLGSIASLILVARL